MNVLIDTCVFLDVLQKREPFFEEAHAVLLCAANRRINGYLSAKAVTDFYYLLHRVNHSDSETRKILSKLVTVFGVANTNGSDCQKALLSETSVFEDAVMIETAEREGMDCIVTRNVRDYAKSKVRVLSPCAFLRIMEKETT